MSRGRRVKGARARWQSPFSGIMALPQVGFSPPSSPCPPAPPPKTNMQNPLQSGHETFHRSRRRRIPQTFLSQETLSRFPHKLMHSPVSWSGLFTSPHLLEVTERVRVNGNPLTKEAFAKYFFEVWDRLQATRGGQSTPTETNGTSKGEGGGDSGVDSPADMPTFFHLVTLVSHQGEI